MHGNQLCHFHFASVTAGRPGSEVGQKGPECRSSSPGFEIR